MAGLKVSLGPENTEADKLLSIKRHDGSGVGINYLDAYIKGIKVILDDGRKITAKRRGLKVSFTVGDRIGDGLLRRIEHGPDEKTIVHKAIEEAVHNAGGVFSVEDGTMFITLE